MDSIKTIRNKVALNCSTYSDIKPIDFVALIIVELLGYVKSLNSYEDSKDFKKLISIVNNLHEFVGRQRFTKESLLKITQEAFLDKYSTSELSAIVGNIAFYEFPDALDGPMRFKAVSTSPPKLRDNYGTKEYAPSVENPVEGDEKVSKDIDNTDVKQLESASKPITLVKSLSDMPEILALKKFYNKLQCDKRYFWQWKISTEDYEAYKKLLIDINFNHKSLDKARICAPQLALYIAEWYKREYNGNDSISCLKEIGVTASPKEIWLHAKLPAELYTYEESNENAWLYSMYRLGGFPIKYVNKSSRFSFMFDEIWGEDSTNDSISDAQIIELTESFKGNQPIRNSLISGSLHDYYRYLRNNGSMPIADTDCDKSPFKEFIDKLVEGKNNYFKNFIKHDWVLYLEPGDPMVYCDFVVRFGKKDGKCYIPYECLDFWSQHWNTPSAHSITEFSIEVVAGKYSKSIRFSKTGSNNNPYVGWTRENTISLPVQYDIAQEICVYLNANGNKYLLGKPIKNGKSCQFYKTSSPYEWSTKTDNSSYTAVLYDPSYYSCDDTGFNTSYKIFEDGGVEWKWLILTEEIILNSKSSDGEPVLYKPLNSSLEISFKTDKAIYYKNFRDITYCWRQGDEIFSQAIPLLRENGFKVKYTPYNQDVAVNVQPHDYDVYFKQGEMQRFELWTNDYHPQQGFMNIRIVYSEKGISAQRKVYFIPGKSPIVRDLKNKLIIFNHKIKDIHYPSESGYHLLTPDSDGVYAYEDDVIGGFNIHCDTIEFIIGNIDKEYIILPIYRAQSGKDLFLINEKKMLHRYDNTRKLVDIPIALCNNFEIRTIDDSGVSRTKCGRDVYISYDFDICRPTQDENHFDDNHNDIRYYIVKNLDSKSKITGELRLETEPSQYRFYFWSMRADDNPIPVNFEYKEDTKILTLDVKLLNKHKRGIIFQSLKGLLPRHYTKPIYGENSFYQKAEIKVKCFEIAAEHGIPFQTFRCLKDMFGNSNTKEYLTNFLRAFLDSRNWKLTHSDYKNLQRFASEFLFDWIMVPRRWWGSLMKGRSDRKECQDVISKLFRTAPYLTQADKQYLEQIIAVYWSTKVNDWTHRRDLRNSGSILIQCIRNASGDYSCFDPKIEISTHIDRLRSTHKPSNNTYEKLYKFIFNTIR